MGEEASVPNDYSMMKWDVRRSFDHPPFVVDFGNRSKSTPNKIRARPRPQAPHKITALPIEHSTGTFPQLRNSPGTGLKQSN